MSATFYVNQSSDRFAAGLAHLAQALTGAKAAYVGLPDGTGALASAPQNAILPNGLLDVLQTAAQKGDASTEAVERDGALAIAISLPNHTLGALLLDVKGSGHAARALAYERLVGLAQLSRAMFNHPDVAQLAALSERLGAPDPDLGAIASDIRHLVDADQIALALFQGETTGAIAVSDQPDATTRASLPEAIKTEFSQALRGITGAPDIHVARNANGGALLKAETPRRNTSLLPILTATLANGTDMATVRATRLSSRLARFAGIALILGALGFVPLPDARRVSAEVISSESRTITAPFSGIVLKVHVAENDAVTASETALFELDTGQIVQELAVVQAEFSRALLDRESARGARDALALRNAELEAERLRAKTELLDARRESARLIAPIDGLVIGTDLDTFLGATVRQGDTLLQVVNPDTLALRLEVPDDMIARIEDDDTGVFRPDFNPAIQYDGVITHISPAQSDRRDVAVFEGRATLSDTTETLRPGLRGVFVFERRFTPFWQIAWKTARDWVLLRWWI